MNLQLPHCIERLVKAGRVVIISKSVVMIDDIHKSRNIIPFGQTRLTEYGGSNGQECTELLYAT